MNLKNVFSYVKGNKWLLAVIGVLVGVILFMGGCEKKVKESDCVEFSVSYCEEALADLAKKMEGEYSRSVDSLRGLKSEVKVVVEEKVVYKDHSTFVKNYEDLVRYKELAEKRGLQAAENERLLSLTREELDSVLASGTVVEFRDVERFVDAPIVKTTKNEVGEFFKIDEVIFSKDSLVDWERNVVVYPRLVTNTRPPNKEEIEEKAKELEKYRHLAIKGGALFLDEFNTVYYTPSVEFGYKWFVVEGGVLLDEDFGFDWKRLEGKVGFMVRF